MNQRKTIRYKDGQMPAWIMEQLSMETMKVFFPVSFMKEETCIAAVFQTDGYRPLAHIHNLSTEDMFQMFCQLLAEMENNEKHYLFPDCYCIDENTVYFDSLKNRVKMVFLPCEEALHGKEQLRSLVLVCKDLVSEEGKHFLEDFAKLLEKAELNYRSAIHHCELMQQEIYVCDIP